MDISNPERELFGRGRLTIEPRTSVFLNCPFDREYQSLFDAIIFASVCSGFMPRSALETGDVSPRMERITRAIFGSKYSIHDLSRCTGLGDLNFARFNMPLELGIAMASRYMAAAADTHDFLVLVPDGHAYSRFISDFEGFDPYTYDGSVPRALERVVAWLATRKDAVRILSPAKVLTHLPTFEERLADLRSEWGPDPPWADRVIIAQDVAKKIE